MALDLTGIVAVGLSHHTAPVEVRERLALPPNQVPRVLQELNSTGATKEAMLLSTCNRVELYAVPGDDGERAIKSWLSRYKGPKGEPLDRYLYWHYGRDAVRHLFRVASSLDSMILGEPQILGQVKTAVKVAEESKAMGRVLHRVTQRTLQTAKRVRSETAIGRHRVGVGNASVELASQVFGGLQGRRAMLVGTGEMGQQIAQALLSHGLTELVVANRTFANASALASLYSGTAIALDKMADHLPRVDMVISAAGAPEPFITRKVVSAALKRRRWAPLFLIDVSVPRNISSDVADLEEAYLFNVDDLHQVVEEGRLAREQASKDADQLVEEEADRCLLSLREVDVGPVLGALTSKVDALRLAEIERTKGLGDLSDQERQALDKLTKALTKKILHGPLMELRQAAREGDQARMERVLALWDVEVPK